MIIRFPYHRNRLYREVMKVIDFYCGSPDYILHSDENKRMFTIWTGGNDNNPPILPVILGFTTFSENESEFKGFPIQFELYTSLAGPRQEWENYAKIARPENLVISELKGNMKTKIRWATSMLKKRIKEMYNARLEEIFSYSR